MSPIRRFALVLSLSVPVFPQGRDIGRSMTITQQGIVATSQTLASQAGAQILARGGSAVDAAIAANAVLAVMEPMMNGPGGDLLVLYYDAATGKLTGLNATGAAPRLLTPDYLAKQNIKTMPARGIHTTTVPGAVDGWFKIHQRFGKLPWKDLFNSAIAYADQGFPVTEGAHEYWVTNVNSLKANPESTRVFLPNGKAPEVGEIFRNPDLARTFRILAEQGPSAFYKGELAGAILKTSKAQSGTMTSEDLAGQSAEWVDAITTTYRGWRVAELPPNTQGVAALEMLNIMETMPAAPISPYKAEELHRRIESMKLAYADLRFDGDPRFTDVPVRGLLSKDYAKKRAALIDPKKANCNAAPGVPLFGDTTYLTTVDKDGNIVSWIQSLFSEFGSGITVDGAGFILHNRGASFTLEPKHPNVLAGGKRPFHTLIPGFMEKGDQHIGFGIMGGSNQAMAHAQFVSNIVDYGINVQEAMDSARFRKANATGCDVLIESRVPEAERRALSERSHKVTATKPFNAPQMGRGQAILYNSTTRTKYGASDPRADGSAVPEPIQ